MSNENTVENRRFIVSVDIEVEARTSDEADEIVMEDMGFLIDHFMNDDVGIRKVNMGYDGNAIEGEL